MPHILYSALSEWGFLSHLTIWFRLFGLEDVPMTERCVSNTAVQNSISSSVGSSVPSPAHHQSGNPRSLDQQIRYLSDRFQAKIFRLHCQEMDVSSAMLRQMAAQGVPIDSYLPPGVADYSRKNGLYRKKTESE